MKTYTIRNKATVRVAQALSDALNVPLKPYDQFYLPMLGRYAKTQREQVEALLDLVNKGLAVNPDALENAKYSDGATIFDCHVEVQEETSCIESIILNDSVEEVPASVPEGYTVRKHGIFGKWSLWLDDTLGTIIGNGYESKDAAIQAAWQHKESNQLKGETVNDTIQRLLDLRAKCTTDELASLNRIILEVDGQWNMSMAQYSYHANNIAHLLCAEDRFALVPDHVVHYNGLYDDSGDFDDMGMQSYADCYHSAQKVKYGLL